MRIERFSNLVIEGQIARAPYFKSLALMLSKPIALFVFRESREHQCYNLIVSLSWYVYTAIVQFRGAANSDTCFGCNS